MTRKPKNSNVHESCRKKCQVIPRKLATLFLCVFWCENAHLSCLCSYVCVCVCVCVCRTVSPKVCCSPACNTRHYTQDEAALSNLTLIHLSKFKVPASLDGFQTFPQPLDSSGHYSPCLAVCLLHNAGDDPRLVLSRTRTSQNL